MRDLKPDGFTSTTNQSPLTKHHQEGLYFQLNLDQVNMAFFSFSFLLLLLYSLIYIYVFITSTDGETRTTQTRYIFVLFFYVYILNCFYYYYYSFVLRWILLIIIIMIYTVFVVRALRNRIKFQFALYNFFQNVEVVVTTIPVCFSFEMYITYLNSYNFNIVILRGTASGYPARI